MFAPPKMYGENVEVWYQIYVSVEHCSCQIPGKRGDAWCRQMLEDIMDDESELREVNLSSRVQREDRRRARERERLEREMAREREEKVCGCLFVMQCFFFGRNIV